MDYLIFILICGLWGSNFLLMKKAHLVLGALGVAGWRVAGGAMVLALIWRLQRTRRWPLRRRDLLPLIVVVLTGYVWPYTLQPHLIGKHGESGFFGIVVVLVPIMTILASVPLLGVYPSRRELVGVVGGLGFVALLFEDGITHRAMPIGDLLLALSVPAVYAVSNTCVKRQFSHVSPLVLACAAMSMAAAILLPASFALESLKLEHERVGVGLAAIAVLATIGTGLSTYLFYRLVLDRGPLLASMVTYLVPVVALLWGLADGESVTATQVLALLGIAAMVALVQFQPRRRPAKMIGPAEPP